MASAHTSQVVFVGLKPKTIKYPHPRAKATGQEKQQLYF